jgi:hypothetical protein
MKIKLEIIGSVVAPIKEPVDENCGGFFLIKRVRCSVRPMSYGKKRVSAT